MQPSFVAQRLIPKQGWLQFTLVMLLLSLLLSGGAHAAEAVPPRDSTVSVVGTATLKLAPDQVTVPVTISTENAELTKAKEENDKKVKKVISLAEKFGAGKDDISTAYHSVEPQMSYGNDVRVEVDVFTTSVNYNIDVRGLAEDKLDALSEALQKANLSNVNVNKTQGVVMIYASFNTSNEKQEVVRDKVKANQDAVIKIATGAGVAREKIGINTNTGKGKETRTQPYKQRVEKYKAVVMLNVVLKEKDKAVEFVNASLKEGVENVGSIQFSLKDEKAAQDKASLEALKDAKRRAAAIADAMGVAIDKPLAIADSGAQLLPIQPYPMMRGRVDAMTNGVAAAPMFAMKMADQAVAEPDALPTGLIEIRASVNATFLLKQK